MTQSGTGPGGGGPTHAQIEALVESVLEDRGLRALKRPSQSETKDRDHARYALLVRGEELRIEGMTLDQISRELTNVGNTENGAQFNL